MTFEDLVADAHNVAKLLIQHKQRLAVAESSTGGLISAAMLAVPGASAYFLGGGVVYTPRARHRLMDLKREEVRGMRGATPAYASALAERAQTRFRSTWGLSETGATGPRGNPYGDPAGHSVIAVAGPQKLVVHTLQTGQSDRLKNMLLFSRAALGFLQDELINQNQGIGAAQ